ncbi:S-layer homology domain-containing protein [Lysinibacillus xylanilyticus]|uniref:S-layer homology domain-containing protein n=1 Tax=Lysinibacillus xylanilyticus TaxID=582475 RepID=UPI00380EB142
MKKISSKKKMFNVAMASALTAGAVVAIAPASADAAAVSFKDVPANSTHAEAISNLVERGIINGFPDGTFGPNKTVTRGQAAKIIAGMLELDTKNVKNPNFKDVKTTDEFYGAIAALKAEGIISGNADGTYGQKDPLTRGQMAKILVEAFDLEGEAKTPFTDVPANNIFAKYIEVLYANDVTKGLTATTFGPKELVTRGQLASFVVRAEPTETSETNTVTAKITEVKAGQIVTSKGTFKIDASGAKVFNEANEAALKNADVELTIEDGKVIGVKSLTLNAENTTFNAGGVSIPNLVVNADKVTISFVKADTINVGKNITVTFKEVKAAVVNLGEGSKLTLDTKTVIEKLNLPANAKLENVITNFAELKDKIKDIIKNAVVGGTVTGGGGSGGSTGGGTGGGSVTPGNKTAEDKAEDLLDTVFGKLNQNTELSKFGTISLDKGTAGNGVITVKLSDSYITSNPNVTIQKLASELEDLENNNKLPSMGDLVGSYTVAQLQDISSSMNKVVIKVGDYNKTVTSILDLGSSITTPNKDSIVKELQNIITVNNSANWTLEELKKGGKASSTLTVNFKDGTTAVYTLTIK